MKPFVKTLAASSLLVLSLSSTPALAAKIGVTMSAFDDNFLTVLRNGMGKYAESQKDISLQFEDAQDDVGKQLNQVQNFISQKTISLLPKNSYNLLKSLTQKESLESKQQNFLQR